MTKETGVAKSSLVLQKEEELKELKKKYKKLTTSLSKQKSGLQTMKNDIVELQQKVANEVFNYIENIKVAKEELKEVLKSVKKSKLISKEDKKALKALLADIEDMEQEEIDEEETTPPDHEHEENWGKLPHDILFDAFKVDLSPEETQQIRKVFVRLANQFHPDKASSPQEAEIFHNIMQRLNEAYKRGDIGELLEIEAQYASGVLTPKVHESGFVDFLDREIKRMQAEIELVEMQLTRVKQESGSIKKSPLGKLYKQRNAILKSGQDPVHLMTEDLKTSYEELVWLRDNLKEFAATGKMPEAMVRRFQEEQEEDERLIMEFFNNMFQMEEEEGLWGKQKSGKPLSKKEEEEALWGKQRSRKPSAKKGKK